MVGILWAKMLSRDVAMVACVTVSGSRSEPGGGPSMLGSESVGDTLGTSLGGIVGDALGTSLIGIELLWSIFGAGVGGG